MLQSADSAESPDNERSQPIDEYHIVVATDERFALPTATTLRSIARSNTAQVTVTVLYSGVPSDAQQRIEDTVAGSSIRLNWVDMADFRIESPANSPLPAATMFRLYVGDVMPQRVSRVLYLDSDVLVQASIESLWDSANEGTVVRAVRSVNFPSICSYGAVDNWARLRLDPRAAYFNAGVLMIDLTQWRQEDVRNRVIEYLSSPLAGGRLADQEALNVVLSERWGELHPKWNMHTPFLSDIRGVQMLYDDETIEEARRAPCVIHFSDRPKPWHRGCTHPARFLWREIAAETAFAPIRLDRTSPLAQARWRVRRAASAILKGR